MKIFFNHLIINNLIFAFFLILTGMNVSGKTVEASAEDSLAIVRLNAEARKAQNMGDFEKAVSLYQQSFGRMKTTYGAASIKPFLPLVNMGVAYKNLGDYDRALAAYRQAEQLLTRLYGDKDPRLGFVYSNTGTVYKIQGDYIKYNDFQREALRVLLKDSLAFNYEVEIARMNIAESLILLKKYDEAIESCKSGITRVNNEVKSHYTSLLARIYADTGDPGQAEAYFQETFQILRKLHGEESYELGLEYTDYVSFLLSANRLERVPYYNDLAAQITVKYFTERSTEYSDVMLNQAEYYYVRSTVARRMDDFRKKRRADLARALSYYQKAVIAATSSFSNPDPFSNPLAKDAVSEIHLLQVIKKKARCLEALGDLNLADQQAEDAIKRYRAAMNAMLLSADLIHLVRTGYVAEDSRLILSESEGSVFSDAVNLCYKLYQQTGDVAYAHQAFQFAERGKSASFLAAVTDSRAKKFGNLPDSLVNREQVLKLSISKYKQMLFEENQQDEPDSARLALYNSKLFQYAEKYDELIKFLEKNFPDYYAFKYNTDVTDVKTVRKRLQRREALVEYLIDDHSQAGEKGVLFRFVITRDDFSFTGTAIDSAFNTDISRVHGFLTDPAFLYTGLKEYKSYVSAAYRLQQQLLGDIKGLIGGKRVIVIPDDQLSYLPFDALLSSMPDTTGMNFRNLPYLVKDYPFSYTYSATLLYAYFSRGKEANKRLLAFAPAYLNDDRDDSQIARERHGLLPLPFVSKEVDYVNTFVPGDVFKGMEADEGRFKKMAGEYDILHLAMHTIINDSLPLYSGLAFARPRTSDSREDGWLNTNEIYNLNLKARMAVLSACNTGTGILRKGEGVMSLARGFLYAGCPSIVMSLWEVDDESGSLIMKEFYRLLSGGKNKDEALRLAKLAHIEKADPLKAHPHYWLAFVTVGNAEALFTGKDIYLIVILFAVILLFTFDQLVRRKKRSRRS